MVKHLFECQKCGNKWSGRPIAERKFVRTDSDNKPVIKCPGCGSNAGHFISGKVPGDLLKKKSIVAKRAAEVKADITEPEKDFDTYLRLLDKTKSAESLKHSIRQLSSGSEDFDKLLKILLLKNAQGGGGDIEGLKRDINDIKVALASSKSNPGPNLGPSAGELLLKRVVESIPLNLNPPAPA
ncbi:unnamed protein product, partial [marine sediment metagenome]